MTEQERKTLEHISAAEYNLRCVLREAHVSDWPPGLEQTVQTLARWVGDRLLAKAKGASHGGRK